MSWMSFKALLSAFFCLSMLYFFLFMTESFNKSLSINSHFPSSCCLLDILSFMASSLQTLETIVWENPVDLQLLKSEYFPKCTEFLPCDWLVIYSVYKGNYRFALSLSHQRLPIRHWSFCLWYPSETAAGIAQKARFPSHRKLKVWHFCEAAFYLPTSHLYPNVWRKETWLVSLQVIWCCAVGDVDRRGAVQGCGLLRYHLGSGQQQSAAARARQLSRELQTAAEAMLVSRREGRRNWREEKR